MGKGIFEGLKEEPEENWTVSLGVLRNPTEAKPKEPSDLKAESNQAPELPGLPEPPEQ